MAFPPKLIALAAVGAALMAGPAPAGDIARACTQSDRARGQARLCGCIQQVADRMLTRRDQRLAASFFRDPHRAQEIRMSDRRSDDAFWDRYTAFGETAQRACR